MPRYIVTLPITGYCVVGDIEASSKEEAIYKAMDVATSEHLETWQTHRQICTGNVLHAEINDAVAEEDEE